jgi:uncharacterized membrane protein YqgA involved in biofilm formation
VGDTEVWAGTVQVVISTFYVSALAKSILVEITLNKKSKKTKQNKNTNGQFDKRFVNILALYLNVYSSLAPQIEVT